MINTKAMKGSCVVNEKKNSTNKASIAKKVKTSKGVSNESCNGFPLQNKIKCTKKLIAHTNGTTT